MKYNILFSALFLCILLSSFFKVKELEGRYYPVEGSISMIEYVEFLKGGKCEIKNNLLKTVKSGDYLIKEDVVIINKTGQSIIFTMISQKELKTENSGWKGIYLKK